MAFGAPVEICKKCGQHLFDSTHEHVCRTAALGSAGYQILSREQLLELFPPVECDPCKLHIGQYS